METISRSATRKIAKIKAKRLVCRLHEVGRDYPVEVDPEIAWADLATFRSARLIADDKGWTVRVHGNLWYRLTETEA